MVKPQVKAAVEKRDLNEIHTMDDAVWVHTERIKLFFRQEKDKMDGRNFGPHGLLMQQRTAGEYDGGSQSPEKSSKTSMGNTSPIRYGTMEKREMTEYADFIRTKPAVNAESAREEK